jgi:hypothetical protein
MALTRLQSVHTYSSASGGVSYYFDVVVDAQGVVSVRNIRTPTSSLCDGLTALPQTVTNDMKAATELVSLLQQETEVEAGNVVFTGQTTQAVVIPPGVLNNTNYRVVFTTLDGTLLEATAKTTTGFTVTAATTYGTPAVPKTVGYSVLVKTGGTSDLSGTVTVTNADGGSKAVVFTTPLSTAEYRVLLEPRGFFDAHVPTATKLKTGFTIELGHVPAVGADVDVGYDVFA